MRLLFIQCVILGQIYVGLPIKQYKNKPLYGYKTK